MSTIDSPTEHSSGHSSFSPDILLPALSTGLVNGTLIVIFQSAYAALIFSGKLSDHLASGMGLMLFGAFIMGLVVAITSSFYGTVTAPQDAPTAIMALIAASMGAMMIKTHPPEVIFTTIVAGIALTSLMTGIFLTLLGQFRLGNLIRFIPYPVVGGFLAGTGWILVKGAIGIMSGRPLKLGQVHLALQPDALMRWIPGLLFAILLFWAMRRFRHFLMMPSFILATIAVFYLVLLISGASVAEASSAGFLLPAMESGISWNPLTPAALPLIEWPVIISQAGDLATIVLISVISLLLNASGLELIARQEVDLNRELKSTGLANLLSGFGSSAVGYMSLSLSAFGYRLGSRSRIAGFVSAGICGITLFAGAGIAAYFPKPLLGGLLLYLGLTFLVDWLYVAWFKLPRNEYFLVVLILLTIAGFGFLRGMMLGVLIAVVLFVINYSRIEVVKHQLTGANFRSNVDRAVKNRRILTQNGDQALILKLHGYIFFGTANNVLNQVKARAFEPDRQALKYALLDFRLVSGLDSSALNSFAKMKMLAETRGFRLVFSSLNEQVRSRFGKGGILESETRIIRLFSDLDHGLEWVEEQLLKAAKSDEPGSRNGLTGQLLLADLLSTSSTQLPERIQAAAQQLSQFTEERTYRPGDYLIRQGAAPTGIYILETGQVTAQLEDDKNGTIRLRRMNAGTVIGELGVYLGIPASAAVVANRKCKVLFLSREAIKDMENESPKLAALFHKFIARILGERLGNSNKTLQALSD